MRTRYENAAEALRAADWTVRLRDTPQSLPAELLQRYSCVDGEVLESLGEVVELVSPKEGVWVLGASDYRGDTAAAFA